MSVVLVKEGIYLITQNTFSHNIDLTTKIPIRKILVHSTALLPTP